MAITIKDTVYLGAAKPSSGGGSSNYNDLSNKPQINGVELSGDKTSDDLGVQDKITGTPKNILILNVNGDVTNTKLDSELVELHDQEVESLSGLADTQADVNEEFVEAFAEVKKITETITDNTPTIANVQGNHIYNCTGTLTSLTLTAVETTYNEATIYMTTGASITVNVPASVKTIGYTEFSPNTSYIISFANNTMVIGEINA